MAELSRAAGATVLVIPALKVLHPVEQARDIVAGLILEWAGNWTDEPLRRLEDQVPSLHRVESDDDDIDLRLASSAGQLRMLAGMVRVNRPWRLVLGLCSALAAAVATAAFGLVSSPVWQVSVAISTVRLWVAAVVSLLAIIGWLILNHGLLAAPENNRPAGTSADPALQRGDPVDTRERRPGVLHGAARRRYLHRLVRGGSGGLLPHDRAAGR